MRCAHLLVLLPIFLTPIAEAQAPVLVRENVFERTSQAWDTQRFVFGDGQFFAFEDPIPLPQFAYPSLKRPQHVVAIDALTGKAKPVTETRDAPLAVRFVLKDYLISIGGDYNRVSVIRRSDGKVLGEKRLAEEVEDALIEGDTLYLIQQDKLSRFRIDDMAFLGETPVPQAQAFFNGKVISTRSGAVSLYALSGELLSKVPLGPAGCSRALPLAGIPTNGRHVIAVTDCRRYSVIDVETGNRVFDVPEFGADASGVEFALTNKFLFVRPQRGRWAGPDAVSVFDLATGRELARQPMPQGQMIGYRDRLLLKDVTSFSPVLKVSVYRPDEAVLLKAGRVEEELRAAARKAGATKNAYSAIDILESVSLDPVRSVLGGRPPEGASRDEWRGIASFYGRSLGMTQKRSAEGVAILERLVALYPGEPELQADLNRVKRRAMMLSTDAAIREPVLEALWAAADKRPLQMARISTRGSKQNLRWLDLKLEGERGFVPCDPCEEGGGPGIVVLDRRMWKETGLLSLEGGSVGAIAFGGGRMFVLSVWDEPKAGDIDMHVFDLATLKPLKSWSTGISKFGEPVEALLRIDGAAIGAYDCQYGGKAGYDIATLAPRDAPREVYDACGYKWYRTPSSPPEAGPDVEAQAKALNARIQLVSRKYLIGYTGSINAKGSKLFPLTGDVREIDFPGPLTTNRLTTEVFFTADEDIAVSPDVVWEGVNYNAFDIARRSVRTLIDMSWRTARGGMVGDGRTFFIGHGRSVLAIDMRTGAVLDFAEVFDPSPEDSQPWRGDISRLMVDGGKLIAVSPRAVSVFDLAKLYEQSEPDATPYARTARQLLRR